MSVRSRALPDLAGGIRWFLGPPARLQTYKNLGYLALTFPLGLAYFVFLVTVFSIGLAFTLTIVLSVAGIAMLAVLVLLSDVLFVLERWLATRLLGVSMPLDREADYEEARDRLVAPFKDLGTLVGLFYLVSKFVVGVVTFVLLVMLGSIAVAMLAAPVVYQHATVAIQIPEPIHVTLSYVVQEVGGVEVVSVPITVTSWEVTTLPEALAMSLLGALVAIVSLHLFNGLAWLQGRYAKVALTPRPLSRS